MRLKLFRNDLDMVCNKSQNHKTIEQLLVAAFRLHSSLSFRRRDREYVWNGGQRR